MAIDKRAVIEALRAGLAAERDAVARRARDAAEGATHEENRPEGVKDMRSTEASYVARGQSLRAMDVERELGLLASVEPREFAPGDAIAVSALVELESLGRRSLHMIVPAGGGQRVEVDGASVQTLTPTSPLGAALLGLCEGDEAEVEGPGARRSWAIVRVR